jgi:DNA-binding FrmR family transcriptional regulator
MPKKQKVCCESDVYLDTDVEKDIQNRLSRVRGQIDGVKGMLEEKQDCESLLMQLAAIRAAVGKVTVKLLENHMETCVADSVERGEGEEALNRLRRALAFALK